jgi:hypothetical protein
MLRSERHVALNPADTAASSGRAAATMMLITSGGRSVNLARELLVTIMMLDSKFLCRQGHYSVSGFILLGPDYHRSATAFNSPWSTGMLRVCSRCSTWICAQA